MGEKCLNAFLSVIFGGVSAIGAVWFLYEPPTSGAAAVTEPLREAAVFPKQIDELEIGRLKVTEGIMVHHSESGEPLIELKDGVVLAKKEIISNYIGGMDLVGRKIQVTSGDPSVPDPPVFCELATNEGDGGAYLAILSPKGTHSVNIGFDKNETGFIISRNNEDSSMAAQAILPLPNKGDAVVIDDPNSGVSDSDSSVAPDRVALDGLPTGH